MKAGSLITRNDGRILLCHATCKGYAPRWYDRQWTLPFGTAGFFEKDPWKTAKRETLEESGVNIEELKPKRVFYKRDTHDRYVFEFSGGEAITKAECKSIVPFLGFPEMDAFGWFRPFHALWACEFRFISLFKAYLGVKNDWRIY